MTPPICQIPSANAYRFVQAGANFNSLFNSRPFDAELFAHRLQPWQSEQDYAYKVTFDQEISVQCHDNANTSTLKLLDGYGKIVGQWSAAITAQVAGKVAKLGGITYPLTTRHYVLPLSLIPNLAAGRYRMVIENAYDTDGTMGADTTVLYVSEWLEIAAEHPGTIVVQWRHSRNAHGLIFTQTGGRFTMRVEGWVGDLKPDSRDSAYDDQEENPLMLSSIVSRVWGLNIGAADGVPEYILEKMQYATGCDDLRIEDVQYLKEPAAKFEKSGPQGGAKCFGRIAIKEAKNQAGTVLHASPDIDLFTVPGFPYAAHSLTLYSGARTVVLSTNRIINNAAQEADLVAWVQTYGRALNNLNGVFIRVGNTVRYRNARDEGFTSAQPAILTGTIALTRTLNSPVNNFGGAVMNIQMYSPYITVDWGDGAVNSYGNGGWSTFVASHNHVTIPPSAGVLNRVIRVFYFDTLIEHFNLVDARTRVCIGPLPRALRSFVLKGGGLQTVSSPFVSPFYQLSHVDISGNALLSGSNQVNAVFNNIEANAVSIPNNGFIATNGNTPPAPPTAASSSARQQLSNQQWQIFTD